MVETISSPSNEDVFVEVDLYTAAKYPGVESAVVEVANDAIAYFGDIKSVCWLESINCAPIPSLLPVGFKKNQTSLLVFDFVNLCLYQYLVTVWPSLVNSAILCELPLCGKLEDGIRCALV